MACVGVWVLTEWSVSCLGNSQSNTMKLPEVFYFAPYQLLRVLTFVGVWVVTVGSVSCLGNSQVIPKSCQKLVNLPPINCCMRWHVSCRGRKLTIQLRPTLLHKSPQAAADKKSAKKSCKWWVRGVRHSTYKTLTCKCECLPHNTLHLVSTLLPVTPLF